MDNETYWNGDRLFRGRCFAEHGSRSTIRLKSDSKMGRVGVYTQFRNLLRPLVMMKPLPNEATDRCQEAMTSDAWFFSTISKYLHCRLNGLITVSNYLLVWASCRVCDYGRICEISCLDFEDRSFFHRSKGEDAMFYPRPSIKTRNRIPFTIVFKHVLSSQGRLDNGHFLSRGERRSC